MKSFCKKGWLYITQEWEFYFWKNNSLWGKRILQRLYPVITIKLEDRAWNERWTMGQNLLILCRTKSSSPGSSEENKQYDSGDGSLSIHPVPSRRKKNKDP